MKSILYKLKDRSGQGLSEYMILAMLIVVGSIAASKTLGTTIKTKLETVNEQLQQIHVP
jgi:Flp pilus assembly pilin Flp